MIDRKLAGDELKQICNCVNLVLSKIPRKTVLAAQYLGLFACLLACILCSFVCFLFKVIRQTPEVLTHIETLQALQ